MTAKTTRSPKSPRWDFMGRYQVLRDYEMPGLTWYQRLACRNWVFWPYFTAGWFTIGVVIALFVVSCSTTRPPNPLPHPPPRAPSVAPSVSRPMPL